RRAPRAAALRPWQPAGPHAPSASLSGHPTAARPPKRQLRAVAKLALCFQELAALPPPPPWVVPGMLRRSQADQETRPQGWKHLPLLPGGRRDRKSVV